MDILSFDLELKYDRCNSNMLHKEKKFVTSANSMTQIYL